MLGRLGRHLASVGEFNASNVVGHSDTTRRNYAISIAETLAAGVLLTVAEIATGGLTTFALGWGSSCCNSCKYSYR